MIAPQSSKWVSNPNLLDNWYFPKAVNQRGQTTFTPYLYNIDRWFLWGDSCTAQLAEDGIHATAGTGHAGFVLDQKDDDLYAMLAGKTVTVSVLVTKATGSLCLQAGKKAVFDQFNNTTAVFSLTIQEWEIEEEAEDLIFRLYTSESEVNADLTIVAAKLELGDHQTLAHLENGEWVLNEIPNYWEELRKCQRHLRKLDSSEIHGVMYSAVDGVFLIPGAEMRANPVILNPPSTIRISTLSGEQLINVSSMSILRTDSTGAVLSVKSSNEVTVGMATLIDLSCMLSAEI